MPPGAARVRRLVDTVAYRKIGPAQTFTAADVNRIRIRWRDRQRSDGSCRLVIEDGIPGAAEVRRLPDSAVVRRHVEDIRLAGNTGDRHGASATKRANHAPVKFLIHRRVILLGKKREGKKHNPERGEQSPEEAFVHGCPRRKVRINHAGEGWTAPSMKASANASALRHNGKRSQWAVKIALQRVLPIRHVDVVSVQAVRR